MFKLEHINTGANRIPIAFVSTLADCLMDNVHFAKDKYGRMYYYDGGVYKPEAEDLIRRLYVQLLVQQGHAKLWSETMPRKVIAYIMTQVEEILDRPSMDKINFRNGLYTIMNDNGYDVGKFELHSEVDHSDYRTIVQIPVDYDPEAKCPHWEKFLSEVFPEDPGLLMDIIGLCIVPFTGLQKCIVLLGEGSNGKGTYLDALQKVVGEENYANLDMKRLAGHDSRFNTACLVGKLVNVFGDLPPNKIENTGVFKALTGQDTIMVEYKGRQPFSYRPFARLIFSCNSILESDDTTVGYKRRFFCVPFDSVFEVNARKKQEIENELSRPEELSGLLNNLLPRLPMLIAEGLQYNEAAAQKVENYVPVPKWFKKWFENTFIVEELAKTVAEEAYTLYIEQCHERPEEIAIERLMFIKFLKASTKLEVRTARVNGIPRRCYIGIRLAHPIQKNIIVDEEDILDAEW